MADVPDVQVKRIEDIDFFKGPSAIPGIRFHSALALGATPGKAYEPRR